jgi:glycosyltransferase involved in cell wall biosynthesis
MSNLISIIIPCYNDAKYIKRCFDSALGQTYVNIEIIIVDDGSNIETKAVLNKLEDKFCKLLTQENKGQSAARNAGIKIAKGDYVFVLDSDDYVEPTFCEKAYNLLYSNPEIKIVSCNANLIYDNQSTEIYKPEGGTIEKFLFKNAVLGTSMFRKSDWENSGGYDESMRNGWEDWEFFIRLLKNSGEAIVIDEPLYNYRKRNHSTTSIANEFRYNLYSYIINKHPDLYVQYFENTVSFLLSIAEKNRINELKRLNSIDYKIGNFFLKPFRFFKQLIT